MTMREKLARALKAELGRQMDARPAPGPDPRDDWTATGGTIDFGQCVDAVLREGMEPTDGMVETGLERHELVGKDFPEAIMADQWCAMIQHILDEADGQASQA